MMLKEKNHPVTYLHCTKADIENNTWACGDMKFIFECSSRYLTSERSERVRYRDEHEKMNFISPSVRVLFYVFHKLWCDKEISATKKCKNMQDHCLADINTRKNIVFLRVFRYDISQWRKSLYHTRVYVIK